MVKKNVDERDLIVQKLIEVQRALQLSDQKFSEKIGISRPMWQIIRTGKRGIGGRTLIQIFKAFPPLQVMRDGKPRDLEITIKV
jgi:hypothetical protein